MKLVRVTWDDAEDPTAETWVTDEDLDKFMSQVVLVTSLGYLARQSDRHILLVSDHIESARQYGRVTKIPKAMIVKIEELEEVPLG